MQLLGQEVPAFNSKESAMNIALSDNVSLEFHSGRAMWHFFKGKTSRLMMISLTLLFVELRVFKRRADY
jgi:hypothetical protein